MPFDKNEYYRQYRVLHKEKYKEYSDRATRKSKDKRHQYYLDNKIKMNEYSKLWSVKNRERVKETARLRYIERKEHHSARAKRWRKNNPTETRAKYLRREYGITLHEYNNLFENQNGCCAICGSHQSKFIKSLHVDHCHNSKKIRGLLCVRCNNALGYFKDSVELLGVAIKYLTSHED